MYIFQRTWPWYWLSLNKSLLVNLLGLLQIGYNYVGWLELLNCLLNSILRELGYLDLFQPWAIVVVITIIIASHEYLISIDVNHLLRCILDAYYLRLWRTPCLAILFLTHELFQSGPYSGDQIFIVSVRWLVKNSHLAKRIFGSLMSSHLAIASGFESLFVIIDPGWKHQLFLHTHGR